MKRLLIFAHYDGQHEVKRYILYLLGQMRDLCERIVFVSTSSLGENEQAKARAICDDVVLKENVGLDFGMWRYALDRTDLDAWDEIVLVNSSVFGPLRPLAPIFHRMEQERCDFWGMTESAEIAPHLQSYFLAFKANALRSAAFRAFWQSVLPYRDKHQIIRSYEVGLTTYLSEQGLLPRAVVSLDSLPGSFWRSRRRKNPTLYSPAALVEAGMPFVKVWLLRDNPLGVPLGPVYRALETSGYDLDLVEFDRATPFRPSLRGLLDGARRVVSFGARPNGRASTSAR
jgi:rhamnosyltransferase